VATPTLAPMETAKKRAEPARAPALQAQKKSSLMASPNFLGAAGNMAIQRAAAGPLANNPASAAILGGANMSGGGCSCGGSGGTCEECNKKQIQRKGEGGVATVPSGFDAALHRSGPGAPLGSESRSTMENRFGDSFDDVRIHDDTHAAEAARHIRAHAFTMARDIYFAPGLYQPASLPGQKLLAHELTHVLQQRRGAVPPGLKSLNATAHDDIFEHEAEQAEAHVAKEEHNAPAALPGSRRQTHGNSELSGGRSVQRKCACGGTCAKCSGQGSSPILPELRKTSIQRKSEDILDSSERISRPRKESTEHPLFGQKKVQRKCACGGTCSKCSGEGSGLVSEELKRTPAQRKSEDTLDSPAKASPPQKKEAAEHSSSPEKKIQRKCACGGTCSKCSGAEEELKAPLVQRKAETASEPAHEKTTATRENKMLREKLGKIEGPRGGKGAGRQAGAAAQARSRGNRPGSLGHNPAPAIQRSASGTPARFTGSARSDKFEREADAAANDVAQGRQVSSEKLSRLDEQGIQPLDWEFCIPYVTPGCTASSTAEVVSGEVSEIASDVWDAAKELAHAVHGVLSYVDNLLTITIPPQHVCDAHSIQFTLPEIGTNLPFLKGAVPIAEGVLIYGEVGLHLGVIPEIALQVGPCETHEITIAIHRNLWRSRRHGCLARSAAGGSDSCGQPPGWPCRFYPWDGRRPHEC